MTTEERIIDEIRKHLKSLNEETYHVMDNIKGPIDLSVVFDTDFGESTSFNSQDLYIDLNIFNTGNPSNTHDLIHAINKQFSNRILRAEHEFIVKFPQERPITQQRILETQSPEITHVQCTLQARITYNAIDRQPFQITTM